MNFEMCQLFNIFVCTNGIGDCNNIVGDFYYDGHFLFFYFSKPCILYCIAIAEFYAVVVFFFPSDSRERFECVFWSSCY